MGRELPHFFMYAHNLDTDQTISDFIENDLLEYSSINLTLSNLLLPTLKDILRKNILKVSGTKNEIIKRLIESLDSDYLFTQFPNRFYTISEIGKKLISNNLTEEEYNDRYSRSARTLKSIDTTLLIGLIHEKDFDKATQYINNSECSAAILHSENYQAYHDFLSYDIKLKDKLNSKELSIKEYIILYHMLSVGSEIAQPLIDKDLKITISQNEVHRLLRIITAIDDLISQKSLRDYMSHYTIQSMQDSRTCPYCKRLQDKLLNIADAVIGVNYPPFDHCTDEYCRCFVSLDID